MNTPKSPRASPEHAPVDPSLVAAALAAVEAYEDDAGITGTGDVSNRWRRHGRLEIMADRQAVQWQPWRK